MWCCLRRDDRCIIEMDVKDQPLAVRGGRSWGRIRCRLILNVLSCRRPYRRRIVPTGV